MFVRRWNVVEAVVIAASVLWVSGGVARGDAIASPYGMGDQLGNSNIIAPFDPWSPTRTQQVYASTDFSSLKGPQYIDSIVYQSGQFGAALQNMTIAMSTTNKPVDGLSPVFADNTGSDSQTVYQGTLPIFSAQPVGRGPGAFNLVINLQHPFLYDPSKGNLLVDITNPSPEKTSFLDGGRPNLVAQDVQGDSTSRVLGYIGPYSSNNPYSVGDLSHGHPDTLGLVTQFVTGGPDPIPQPAIPPVVPEPNSLIVLSFVGVSTLVWRSRRRSTVSYGSGRR
jgi:hypothetical protein